MSVKTGKKSSARLGSRSARHRRVRKKVQGTKLRPRLGVFRSLKHIYAHVIDDGTGSTLVSASTITKEFQKKKIKKTSDTEAAHAIGEIVAEKALAKGIKTVVFDRGGYMLHGRVKALAQGARDKGLKF